MSVHFSVIIPAYNEGPNLEALIREVAEVLQGVRRSFEIVLVDDGSKDDSRQLLTALSEKLTYLKVVLLRANSGQTAAIDAGIRNAEGEILVTMDADGQNDPRDIPRMYEQLQQGNACVTGWRKHRHDRWLSRRLPSVIANKLIRKLFRTKLHDQGCALKMFRREVAQELRLYGEMHRFISILIEHLGFPVTEIVVNHRPRTLGQSKYTIARTGKVVLDLVTLWFLKAYRTKPIYVFGGIGLALFGITACLTSVVLWQKFFEEFSINRNPLFSLSIFTSMIGCQFIGLGLLAELLIRNYFETTGLLPYRIEKVMKTKPYPSNTPTLREVPKEPLPA